MGLNQFLNSCELKAFEIMQPFELSYCCRFFPKVKLGDVLEIRGSGIEDEHFDYAAKAHFDFIVVQDNQVLFAIELDGPDHYRSYTTPQRDKKKNYICQHFKFELLRIDLGYLNEVNDQHVLPLLLQNYLNSYNPERQLQSLESPCFEYDSLATHMLEQHAQTVNETFGKYKIKTSTFQTMENGFCYVAKVLEVDKKQYCIGQGSAHPSKILGSNAESLADSLSLIELGRKVSLYEQKKLAAKSLREVESLRSSYAAPEIFPEVRKIVLESYSNQY